jgi:hypothetical protein
VNAPEVTSQATAKAQGLKRFTGKTCGRGHTERWVANGKCVECSRVDKVRHRTARTQPAKVAPVPKPDETVNVGRPQDSPSWRDPGTPISLYRINELIERIFNTEPQADVSEAA